MYSLLLVLIFVPFEETRASKFTHVERDSWTLIHVHDMHYLEALSSFAGWFIGLPQVLSGVLQASILAPSVR